MIITHPTAIHFENIVDEDINDYDYPHFPNYYYYYHYYYDRYFESGERFSAVFRCDVSGSPKPNVYWKKVFQMNVSLRFLPLLSDIIGRNSFVQPNHHV